jgi:protein-disulfide isomerase
MIEGPATGTPAAPPPGRGGSGWAAAVIAGLCLVATLALWWQVRSDLTSLRTDQQQLAAAVAAMRDLPVIDVEGAPALGPEDAVVTLIEYSDYECPFCIHHFTSTMPQIEEAFIRTGEIRYVFRDLPIEQLHPGAGRAHVASRCAAEQGRFWQMHARLFSAPGSHDDAALEAQATEAGLEIEAFGACLASGRTRPDVERSVAAAASLGATGTPSFFLGIRNLSTNEVEILHGISGAQPFEVFERAIRAVAARVR